MKDRTWRLRSLLALSARLLGGCPERNRVFGLNPDGFPGAGC